MSEDGKQLVVTDVPGVVTLMNWWRAPDGRSYQHVAGVVSVHGAERAVGFEPKGHNSANWFCRVAGDDLAHSFMGCQVHSVATAKSTDQRLSAEDIVALIGDQDVYVVP